jgi:hypothetical protein
MNMTSMIVDAGVPFDEISPHGVSGGYQVHEPIVGQYYAASSGYIRTPDARKRANQ